MNEQLYHGDIRRWSPTDDILLSKVYPRGLNECQLSFPNRSIASIIGRAKRLGLARAAAGPHRPWTGVEEAKLRRLWVRYQRSVIQEQIPNRSWAAIVSKAGKIGLSTRLMAARFPLLVSENPLIEQIAARMRNRGLTITDLDEMAGVGRNVTGRWFSDQSRPGLINVERAVEALGGHLVIVWDED